MSGHTTMRRDGGWTLELINKVASIDELVFKPVSLDHTIRWTRYEIPSVLALISELTGVKEYVLKQLTGQDSDRMFVAFSFIAPSHIKEDFEKGNRPLATPKEVMTDAQKYEEVDSQVDEVDPRFPKVDGPVKRFHQQATDDQPFNDEVGVDLSGPNVMKKVG
jgi:hypothetical protein